LKLRIKYYYFSPLQTAKTKHGIELLNSDDHKGLITKKIGKTVEEFRPDIAHQVI